MSDNGQKTELHRYLRNARAALPWKLDGLSEYDVRRPMKTGTDRLGLVEQQSGADGLPDAPSAERRAVWRTFS